MGYRPGGVVVLAVLFIIGAILGVLAGIGVCIWGSNMVAKGYSDLAYYLYVAANPTTDPNIRAMIYGYMIVQVILPNIKLGRARPKILLFLSNILFMPWTKKLCVGSLCPTNTQ